MNASGFTGAPISQLLILYIVVSSLLVSLADLKPYLPILISSHLWRRHQWWRLFTWQATYTNSTEVLLAVLVAYQLRAVERLWGSRKFLSFILLTAPYTLLLPPLLLALFLRPLTLNRLNYLPAGPTPLLFALLAQFHAAVPPLYRYKLGSSTSSSTSSTSAASFELELTSKTLSYVLPVQLALSQFPHAVLPAAVGWAVGTAYRRELLPATAWRVPATLLGARKGGVGVEALRRRLEAEGGGEGAGTGREGGQPQQGRRRTLGGMMGEQFWGRSG